MTWRPDVKDPVQVSADDSRSTCSRCGKEDGGGIGPDGQHLCRYCLADANGVEEVL